VKYEWARKHFATLDAHITAYINAHPSDIVTKPNGTFRRDGSDWNMAIAVATAPIPDDIPLILGDVLSNLRSCMDYLVWELVRAHGETPSDRNSFPICKTIKGFRDAVSRGDLAGVSSAIHAFIESLQPALLKNDFERSYLWVLHEFTNINKHRRLLVAQVTTSVVPSDPNFIRVINGQAKAVLNPPPAQRHTEFGPFPIIDGKIKVDTQFMAYVTFDETPAKDFEILSFIERIFDVVAEVIRHCEGIA
jgi:hypothetical protein